MANGPRRPSLVRQTTEPPVDYGNLTDEQIINMLSSSETREYGGMPLGPGSVLNVLRLGKNLPNILRQLRGLFQSGPSSTAKTGNILKEVVLGGKPAKVSRRGFLTNPFQAVVDSSTALSSLGRPKYLRRGDPTDIEQDLSIGSIGPEDVANAQSPKGQELFDRLVNKELLVQTMDPTRPGKESILYEGAQAPTDWYHGSGHISEEDANDMYEIAIKDLSNAVNLSDTLERSVSDRPGVVGDISSTVKILNDQVLKEAAEAAGRTPEEEREVQRKALSKPGVVSKAVESVRRRYGR
jgi:hypothetical protein